MTADSATPAGAPVLSLHNFTRKFGRHVAVNELTFDVHKGDIFGFLGPNGAGKSTTMYMISGLVRPTSGDIRIFGRPHTQGPEVRRHMGALIETPAFYEYMSGRKNLEVLAKGLLEFETLTGDEIADLLAGKRPVRESVIEPSTPRSSAVPPAGKPRPRPEPPTGEVAPQPQA